MIHFTIDLIILPIGALIGFITKAHTKKGFISFLPYFMLLTVVTEFIGQLTQKPGMNNTLMFNLFTTLEMSYYIYFFREAIYGEKIKKLLLKLLWVFPSICVFNIFFIQAHIFHTYTYTLGSILMVSLGITYFYRLFKRPEHIDLLREPSFWMCIGIVFFYVCGLTVFCIFNYLGELPLELRFTIKKILKLINAFFYLFFIITFLCQRNIRKS